MPAPLPPLAIRLAKLEPAVLIYPPASQNDSIDTLATSRCIVDDIVNNEEYCHAVKAMSELMGF
jgi:hypothetical protein